MQSAEYDLRPSAPKFSGRIPREDFTTVDALLGYTPRPGTRRPALRAERVA